MSLSCLLFTAALALSFCLTASAQTPALSPNEREMTLNCGFVTSRLAETRDWYIKVLNFSVVFENEFYVLLQTPNGRAQISFLLPDHATQHPIFKPSFAGAGAYITINYPDVDAEYQRIRRLGIPVAFELRDEVWGDRHFAIVDPNGIGIDLVTFTPPKP